VTGNWDLKLSKTSLRAEVSRGKKIAERIVHTIVKKMEGGWEEACLPHSSKKKHHRRVFHQTISSLKRSTNGTL